MFYKLPYQSSDRNNDYKIIGVDQFSSSDEPNYISTGDLFDDGSDDEWADYAGEDDEWDCDEDE